MAAMMPVTKSSPTQVLLTVTLTWESLLMPSREF